MHSFIIYIYNIVLAVLSAALTRCLGKVLIAQV